MADWSKKLSVVALVMVCATVLAAMERISADQWLTLAQMVGVAYLGAQGAVDAVAAFRRQGR